LVCSFASSTAGCAQEPVAEAAVVKSTRQEPVSTAPSKLRIRKSISSINWGKCGDKPTCKCVSRRLTGIRKSLPRSASSTRVSAKQLWFWRHKPKLN
jgi:hypothetical protein